MFYIYLFPQWIVFIRSFTVHNHFNHRKLTLSREQGSLSFWEKTIQLLFIHPQPITRIYQIQNKPGHSTKEQRGKNSHHADWLTRSLTENAIQTLFQMSSEQLCGYMFVYRKRSFSYEIQLHYWDSTFRLQGSINTHSNVCIILDCIVHAAIIIASNCKPKTQLAFLRYSTDCSILCGRVTYNTE